jgi:hypothetical protein
MSGFVQPGSFVQTRSLDNECIVVFPVAFRIPVIPRIGRPFYILSLAKISSVPKNMLVPHYSGTNREFNRNKECPKDSRILLKSLADRILARHTRQICRFRDIPWAAPLASPRY